MAFKLSKAQIKERADLTAVLREAGEAYNRAAEVFNAAVEAAWDGLHVAQLNYNAAISDAQQFCADLAEDKRDEYDDKSERWQNGDTGQAASDWIDAWDVVEFEELDTEKPEPVDLIEDTSDLPGRIEDLPEEAFAGIE